ncbi:hypothetical protein FOA43_002196 [Brettanomyces nanus]|uniref:Transfer RNA methyltransferase 82 n=1 Tax=Eeniella nana TaxID=13502 RepID=A0A875RPC1_EENNA|nr:uncharacterized protein FOA43_002196 [Brettanomyces nanus]QPG74860.1 hypothetical protein FOA43_002196 [Brettanomyces nanus]
MPHYPYQHILLNKRGDTLFASAANSVFVFSISGTEATLISKWTDQIDPYYGIRKHHKDLMEKYEREQRELDEAGNNEKKQKAPKMPIPGPGAPPTFTYIRGMHLTRDDTHLIILTDNDKAAVVFKVNPLETGSPSSVLRLVKRQPFPKRPSAVTTSLDDKNILVADKFGDVYSVGLLDTEIQDEEKMQPLLGHVSMLTCIDSSVDENGKECVLTSDRDEHIRVSYYPKSYVIKKWLFGHKEFVSKFVLPSWSKGKVLVSGGGDNFICSWLWQAKEGGELVSQVSVDELVKNYLGDKHLVPEKFQNENHDFKEYCVSDIIPVDSCHKLAFIFERVNALFLFDLKDDGTLSYDKTVDTDADIISGTVSGDILILSVESEERPIVAYKIEKKGDTYDIRQIAGAFQAVSENRVEVQSDDSKQNVPLFTVGGLRKRREH